MIVGDDGVVIIDTLMGPASAQNAFTALREFSDKPVKAIILTHSHGDHIGGAKVFAKGVNPDIYAAENFGSAEGQTKAVNKIKMLRGVRQFGRRLPKNQQTNRGVAPAGTIDHDRGKGFMEPTIRIKESAYKMTISGVDLEIYRCGGETDDALFVWLPNEKVLFSGDNFYSSFPNLYAIRGTAYRNVLSWANSATQMATFKPNHLILGHTMPISGPQATVALNDYSQAIMSVYQQTIAGMNKGKTMNTLIHEVRLPKELAEKPYLTEFYGSIPHAVRSIYTGLLGWFDGNPTALNPLQPKVKAEKMAKLAGGKEALMVQMINAINAKDFQWALELTDYLELIDGFDQQLKSKIKDYKVIALRGLAVREYNAPNRNYYLSYAQELEQE